MIFQSLSVGTPVLISDKTPWTDLDKKGLGWDIKLDSIEQFKIAIEKIASESVETYKKRRNRCIKFTKEYFDKKVNINDYKRMFINSSKY